MAVTTSEHQEQAIQSVVSSIGGGNLNQPAEPEELPFEEYEYDDAFQSRIAAFAVRDNTFVRRTDGLIRPEYFENMAEATLVNLAIEFYQKYRSLPGAASTWSQVLKEAKKAKRIRDDLWPEVIEAFKRLYRTGLNDRDYVVDKVAEFARHQAIQRAMIRSADMLDRSRIDEAQRIMEEAFRVGAGESFTDIDYWNDIDKRTEYRKQVASGLIKPNGIPTGIKKFDGLLYHKGWGRKELSVIMGAAKAGKSMALGEFALRANIQGYNVLYITMEVSNDIIADRIDANVSGTSMSDLMDTMMEVKTKIESVGGAKPHGEFRLVEVPSGTLTPGGLRRILERYRAEGILFDLVAADYADIMEPDRYTDDPRENSKQVWLGLRAIAFEENMAILTATQTNRDGAKAEVAKAVHAAEDFNKIRIADLVISINRSDDEKQAGEARLYFAASRNQGGEFTVGIKQSLDCARFLTSVESLA